MTSRERHGQQQDASDVPRESRGASSRGRAPAELHPVARLPEEWAAVLQPWGERSFRARQVFRWIHARGELRPEQMTDLSKSLRLKLQQDGLAPPLELVEVFRAADDTRKLLLRLSDQRQIECVMIPMTDRADEDEDFTDAGPTTTTDFDDESDDGAANEFVARINASEADQKKRRVTLCVSTQHGCAMGCVFCASGRTGLGRGLGAHEIVAQVLEARRQLLPDEILTNLVFMGMGEPLHHYDETARAISLLSHDDGVGLGLRRMTVSTVGLLRGIERLGEDFAGKVGLAVSLHAPNDALRSQIIPFNERVDLGTLIEALRRYPLPRRRRITIEYTLIAGFNDGQEHAEQLVRLLRPLRVKVNLIAMNPVEGSALRGSSQDRVAQFREWVAARGLSCFVRTRRGDDVSAACGQLALRRDRVE